MPCRNTALVCGSFEFCKIILATVQFLQVLAKLAISAGAEQQTLVFKDYVAHNARTQRLSRLLLVLLNIDDKSCIFLPYIEPQQISFSADKQRSRATLLCCVSTFGQVLQLVQLLSILH